MLHDGKWYGYFGPTPALFRLQMRMLLPMMNGRWHRVSLLLGSLLGLAMALSFYRIVERQLQIDGHRRLRSLLLGTRRSPSDCRDLLCLVGQFLPGDDAAADLRIPSCPRQAIRVPDLRNASEGG